MLRPLHSRASAGIDLLHDFLASHRPELIARCSAKVARRNAPRAIRATPDDGIPLFLEQLITTLELEQASTPPQSLDVSGQPGTAHADLPDIGVAAARHARELFRQGLTIDQVIRNYGDLCQAMTDLAYEVGAPIDMNEFGTLNRCLDDGMADAVTEFSQQHDALIASNNLQAFNARLGVLTHELHNYVHTATLAMAVIKTGHAELNGSMGAVLERSLHGLCSLADRRCRSLRRPSAGRAGQNVSAVRAVRSG